MVTQLTQYVCAVPDWFNPLIHQVRGTNIVNIETSKILTHLENLGPLAKGASNFLGPVNTVLAVANIGVTLATFVALRQQLKETEAAVINIGAKMDLRHKSAMFAGVGASLDLLVMADDLPAQEARALVLANYAPLAKEVRLFSSYLDEVVASLKSPTAAQYIDILNIQNILNLVEVKLLLALDRKASANERAAAGRAQIDETVESFVKLVCFKTLNASIAETEIRQMLEYFEGLTGKDALSLLVDLKIETGKSMFSAVSGEKVCADQLKAVAILKSRAESTLLETQLNSDKTLFQSLLLKDSPEPISVESHFVIVSQPSQMAA
ncbi:hypothetical protein [Sphingomonas immobilis]|uniref:Uncharacterized protein n=1 Tax=Sphingomonas immobilis TaxID=3063997 RepID=A0ABT8ZVR0_9SPHN|nr:hypothetical protein [Sphingomonas sp. CA1-15]MDO7841234.1 hypothetical protein [Sphingomonas sp. CA1-15]